MSMRDKREYFNGLATVWDSLPGPADADQKAERFIRRALRAGDRRILDVGCGTGILLPRLLERRPCPSLIIELDFALAMLHENRGKFGNRGTHRVCADATAPPFPDGCFDAVLCFGVLPHLGDAAGALKTLLGQARPGGLVAIGHLMDSSALNAFHGSLDGPVRRDTLPSADALAEVLLYLGAKAVCAEEWPGWYFVRGER